MKLSFSTKGWHNHTFDEFCDISHKDSNKPCAEDKDHDIGKEEANKVGEHHIALFREQGEAGLQAVGHESAKHNGGRGATGNAKRKHGNLSTTDHSDCTSLLSIIMSP